MGGSTSTQGKLEKGYGYRILKVDLNSNASEAEFFVFLDFILDIKPIYEGTNLDFSQLLNSNEPIELTVYNLYTQKTRQLKLRQKGQQTQYPVTSLGLTLRRESYQNCQVLRITNVLDNSPSYQSGLKANTDFVLGLMNYQYGNIDEFCKIVSDTASRKDTLEVSIFSPSSSNQPKIIKLSPNYSWGGQGCLGCEFASGALHSFNSAMKFQNQDSQQKFEDQQYEMLQEDYQHIEDQDQLQTHGENYNNPFKQYELQKQEENIETQDNTEQSQQIVTDIQSTPIQQEKYFVDQQSNVQFNHSAEESQPPLEEQKLQNQDSIEVNQFQGFVYKSPKQDKPYVIEPKLLVQKDFFIENKHVYLY